MGRFRSFIALLVGAGCVVGCAVGGRVAVFENPGNPLSATLIVDDRSEVTIEVVATSPRGAPTRTARSDDPSTTHELWLLGLWPASTYQIEVRAFDVAGELLWVEERVHRTAPLPEDFVPLSVSVPRREDVSPGVTIFPVNRWTPLPDPGYGLIVGVDRLGQPVFYHRTDVSVQDVIQLESGNLLYISMPDLMVELDLTGRELRRLSAAEIGIDSIHHEVFELGSGNLMTMSSELRRIDGYAPEDGGEGSVSHDVVADVLVEMTPDGEVLQEWSLFDYIDPQRVRGGFDAPFWDPTYSEVAPEGTKDWTHGNSVVHDPQDDSLIVSLRHQDWIIKIDRDSGELLWRFGPEGDFELESGDWAYHQHAPELQDDGTLLVYDNGNGRESLAEGELPYSRVVQYELDEEAMVAREVWEYRGPEPYYAPFLGDADRLDNGNVLIGDGGMTADPFAPIFAPHNHKQARLREVTPDGEIAFELLTPGPEVSAAVGSSWSIYRAERVQLF